MKIRGVIVALAVFLCSPAGQAQQRFLYKASLVQAAPGKLLELIDAYKAPLWIRHSQGDRWDLLILQPAGNYSEYYRAERVTAREKLLEPWREKLQQDIAWQEDVFVYGPPIDEVRKAFAGAGLFHV